MTSEYRVTPEHIESLIQSETYTTGYDAYMSGDTTGTPSDRCCESLRKLTICLITLKNGFTLVGTSSCVDAANYDEQKGRDAARETALNPLWLLEGYLLRQRYNLENYGSDS